jgi:hypothetical protein
MSFYPAGENIPKWPELKPEVLPKQLQLVFPQSDH